jgi:hypothetical protein
LRPRIQLCLQSVLSPLKLYSDMCQCICFIFFNLFLM